MNHEPRSVAAFDKIKKWPELRARIRHNYRISEAENVDSTNTPKNIVLVGHQLTPETAKKTVLRTAGIEKPRGGAILSYEVVVAGTREMIGNQELAQRWIDATTVWAAETLIGEIISDIVHFDEGVLHRHLIVVPTARTGRIPEFPPRWRGALFARKSRAWFLGDPGSEAKRADARALIGGHFLDRRAYSECVQATYALAVAELGIAPRIPGRGIKQQRGRVWAKNVAAPLPEIAITGDDLPRLPPSVNAEDDIRYRAETAEALTNTLLPKVQMLQDQALRMKMAEQRLSESERDRERLIVEKQLLEHDYAVMREFFEGEQQDLDHKIAKLIAQHAKQGGGKNFVPPVAAPVCSKSCNSNNACTNNGLEKIAALEALLNQHRAMQAGDNESVATPR
ncbi:MAG: plasmid recombination protein [Candidatus Didemnitutus sp.]|nr:plasmid recombination protein [Candidatus Didemnitutus sp.]